jgi:phage gp29-like protein
MRTPGQPLAKSGGLPPMRAAKSTEPLMPRSSGLQRMLKPDAAHHWMLPSLSLVTPEYIESILRGALAGSPAQQWELFNLMEDTWPRLAKNLNEVKRAAINLEWTLSPWAEDDKPPTPEAEERAALVSHLLWTMQPKPASQENDFEDTLYAILDAWGKGTSVLEIDWHIKQTPRFGDVTAPRCTIWAHPRNYAWADNGEMGLIEGAEMNSTWGGAKVVEFPPNKFLVAIQRARTTHPLQSALLRPLAWWWCAANFSADWLLNLAQVFGLPFRWANYDSSASQDTVNKVCAMLENMGSSGWAAFPAGTTLELKEPGKSADATPQAGMMDRADTQCDILILGQTLTTSVGDSGSRALGDVHMSVREEIIQAAAEFSARVVNRQLIPAILELNYGDSENAPEFRPEFRKAEDVEGNARRDAVLLDKGIELPKKWFYERHNIPLPQDGEETVKSGMGAPPGMPPGGGKPAQTDDDIERDKVLRRQIAYLEYKRHMDEGGGRLAARDADEGGVWRTIRGTPIFIKDGQSIDDAVKDKFGDDKDAVGKEKKGDSDGGKAASTKLKSTKERAWDGTPAQLKQRLSKLETGEVGEQVAIAYLKQNGYKDARTANIGRNNFPFDVVQNHDAIEVKAGLASNGESAQQWRATIGQPGKQESEWLKTASREEKAAWNSKKSAMILKRKEKAVREASKELGGKMKPKTMAMIINPDTKTADIYEFPGFHSRIPWRSDTARKAYKGSFRYG